MFRAEYNFRTLDAYIYDGMVLNYAASQDDECRLIQVSRLDRYSCPKHETHSKRDTDTKINSNTLTTKYVSTILYLLLQMRVQVGTWSAMTGYAVAFPKNSKYAALFNEKILEMRENGDLERLSRFWMSGMCKPNEQEKKASEPLCVS